jgi:hypothetical protein
VGAAQGLNPRFGHAEGLHLSLRDEGLHRSGDLLDGHVGIDPVLVKQIDGLHPQALQRALDGPADVLRPAGDAAVLTGLGIDVEAELGGDHHPVAYRPQGFAYHLLVDEGAVDLGGVEEAHAPLDGRADQGDALFLGEAGRIAEADAHASQADGRDFKAAPAEFSRFHVGVPSRRLL